MVDSVQDQHQRRRISSNGRRPSGGGGSLIDACRAGAKGEEMIGKNSAEVHNMRQRTILQHLSLAEWRMVDRLPVSVSELTLSKLLHHGWIESQGEGHHMAIRLTPAGLEAMRSPV